VRFRGVSDVAMHGMSNQNSRVVTATDGQTCPSVRPSHPIRLVSVT
jgi:hypothetical protein